MAEAAHGTRGRPSTSATGSDAPERLADQLGALARELQSEDDVAGTLAAIVHAACGTVPGAGHASISAVRHRREVSTRAATGDLPRAVDEAQYAAQQGPCLDSLYQQVTVRLADTATEQRWPDFSARARDLGVRSMLAVQLYVDGDDLGALNLFAEQPGAFGDDAEHVALLFASHAAVALAGAQTRQELRAAVQTRDLIGQAKGVLIERHRLTGDQAFAVLVRASQRTHRKLADIAEELVTSGQLPVPPQQRERP